ncbi:PAS domain-containing protein [Rhizorhabdus argentea]|uniref:PAS domain-containing protein n=1 Tax=Rhizorhabdus argentea TaxID=1387174 RepID=UPI0030EB6637
MTSDPRDEAEIARYFGASTRAAALMAQIDWRSHPLGPPDGWPDVLRITLRNMLASPESLFLVWGESRSLLFNDAYIPILAQRTDDAAIGACFDDVWSNRRPSVADVYGDALGGRAARLVDERMDIGPAGATQPRWWTFSFAPIFDDDGAVAGVQGLISETTDIVMRAESERLTAVALAASEHRLHRAQEAGKVGIFTIDRATKELVGTAEFFRIFGLPRRPVIPVSEIEEMVLPEDRHSILRREGHRSETMDPHVEYRIRRPDNGEIRCIERRAEFERDEHGRAVRVVGVVQDVTERHAARAALAESNATLEARVRERTAERNLLATIVEETDSLVFVADCDYRWLAVNRAGAAEFERIYGKRPRIGERIPDTMGAMPDHRALLDASWGRALAGEEFTIVREVGYPDRSDLRIYEMKFNVLRNEEGAQIGAFQMVWDITERVRAEAAYRQMQETLRQSQKMEAMGQLTGGVAHDFNNLLTPIIGSLDLLQRRGSLSEREARLVDGALQSAERAKTLVQRLLAFARRQPLQPGPVEMIKLVEGMAELVASTSGPRIKIHVDVPDTLPPALADHNQLEMAVLNLCVNARDAMPDGGTITIAARLENAPSPGAERLVPGAYVRLAVIDTGTGMDKDTLRRAVEPFYSTKGVGKGTGLGLSMVDGLASQLGGTMTIASRPGLGTRIDLWLPVCDAAGTQSRIADEAAPPAQFRGRAMVVDDEPLVRITTADMLQGMGYETEEFESAHEAERLLRAGRRFDLVVTDHLMPGMSGAELARSIRRHWPELPVLIVSGYADAETLAPDMPRLTKPFRETELMKAIAELG